MTIAEPHGATPFHDGELALQTRAGVKEKIAPYARRAIRNLLTEELREFFEELPYVFVASLDGSGQPWASMAWGVPGFASSPEPTLLQVAGATASGDPLARQLAPGAPVGVLGIQLETRRRNRVNGVVMAHEGSSFSLQVTQAFGNCQKYIQVRRAMFQRDPGARVDAPVYRENSRLSEEARRMLSAADTVFIASRSEQPSASLRGEGVDVSHRGGLPGFLRLSDDAAQTTLTLPDYTGNFLFNTLGNLERDPRAGLLVVDFERGGLLTLTGDAHVIWEGPEVRAVPGAQRLVRIAVREGVRMESVLPFTWTAPEFSAQLARGAYHERP
jgi:predicted pyridoxine 5'-phosphate oxidase superfamily flavin-nucleotide-binding protein